MTPLRVGLGLLCALVACAGDSGQRPVATLSASAAAGSALSELETAFEHDQHDSLLISKFEAFIRKFPRDVATPLARLYLGHLDVDVRDVAAARTQMSAVAEPPPGNAHDFWLALRARLLMRDNHADQALVILQPLVGTVVDTPLRTILLEEVAVASIDSHQTLEAVGYLDGWLRSVPPHAHKAAHDRVAEQLARMDPNVVKQALDGTYSGELERMLAETLAKHAIDAQDTQLAQRLIDSRLATYLTGTAVGQDLRDLATSLRGARAVVARTIGLVLPTDTAELRDAAADAARGAAFALGLPRSSAEDDGTHLVTRADTTATLDASLEELAGAGAAVVLAGVAEDAAERACRWAEQNGLAVITLSAPKTPGTKFCFVAGEPRATSLSLIVAELEKRPRNATATTHKKTAVVTGAAAEPAAAALKSPSLDLLAPFRCEPPFSRSRLPMAEWNSQGVRGWIVSAPSGCVRTLVAELPAGTDVGLSLESSVTDDANFVPRTVHAFAVSPAVASDAHDDFKQKLGAKPSYWAALGRDAALLAHTAEAVLPTDRVTSPSEVTKRREIAREALARAKATLWTTDATGFDEGHRLTRTLRIVDLK